MLNFRLPPSAIAMVFPNRVDVISRSSGPTATDSEGGRVDVDVTRATGLACSVQPGAAHMRGPDLGLLLSEGQVPVFFPSDPGVAVNDVLVQTDATPHQKYTVVDSEDQGSLGLVWMVTCMEVEGA